MRPGELRNAEWAEIDLEEVVWNIPAHKMKGRQAHLVPLCTQAIEILTELKQLTGASKYVFPSGTSIARPMSNNAILAALRRMGYDEDTMTGHGFRAMARTILDEVLNVRPEYIEHQLAHSVKDPLGRAYNRTTYLPKRRKMMQLWADYLDGLKKAPKHSRSQKDHRINPNEGLTTLDTIKQRHWAVSRLFLTARATIKAFFFQTDPPHTTRIYKGAFHTPAYLNRTHKNHSLEYCRCPFKGFPGNVLRDLHPCNGVFEFLAEYSLFKTVFDNSLSGDHNCLTSCLRSFPYVAVILSQDE